MKVWKKVLGTMLVVGLFYIGGTVSVHSQATVPGSIDDPIVSKSYVDEQLAKLRAELSGQNSASQPAPAPAPTPAPQVPSSGTAAALVVEELSAGQSLIGGAGTEIIIRTGKAVILTNEHGEGIPDLTAGTDLKGTEVPLNHHLLVPRNDGRGVKVIEGPCFIMVRGDYMIQ